MKSLGDADTGSLVIKHANLHLHSSYSDGVLKPKTIIEKAIQSKIDLISITDHDTVESYKHLPSFYYPLRILPGIEFSSTWEDLDVHILGYGVDTNNIELLEILSWMKDGRHTRAEKMLAKLSNLGIKIPFEKVLSYAGEMQLIVRPHIAKALVANNHCKSKQEAFEMYIGNDAPAYEPKPVLSTAEVIRYIHNAGGVAIVAHPGKLKSIYYINDFMKIGIDGLEVYHPDHHEGLRRELAEFCLDNNLLQTGGSDFHGEEESGNYFRAVPATEIMLRDIKIIWEKYVCSRN